MTASTTMGQESPYVGPMPFKEGQAKYFFGRDVEIRRITSQVIAHPISLLFAQSGAGKSSLLNAGLIPSLRAADIEVIGPLRVSGGEVSDDLSAAVFQYHLLSSLPPKYAPRDAAAYCRECMKPGKNSGHPVGPFAKLIGELDIEETRDRSSRPVVVLLDQFEELFTKNLWAWKQREQLFEDFATLLEEHPRFRILLSMREEFIGELDPYTHLLPERLRTRSRLEKLSRDSAIDSVVKPAELLGWSFEEREGDIPGAAELLVDRLLVSAIEGGLPNQFVEPVHLQLICTKLWQEQADKTKCFTKDDIESTGDVETALEQYYDESVSAVCAELGADEGHIRRWFEDNMITSLRTRGMAIGTGDSVDTLRMDVVEALARRWLVRPEHRGNATWYELSHDRFVMPIIRSNETWRAKQGLTDGVAINALEERARKWVFSSEGPLLSGAELYRVRMWMTTDSGRQMGMSDRLQRFVRDSEVEVERSARRRASIMAGALSLTTVGLVVAILINIANAKTTLEAERKIREDSTSKLATSFLDVARKNKVSQLELVYTIVSALDQVKAPVSKMLKEELQRNLADFQANFQPGDGTVLRAEFLRGDGDLFFLLSSSGVLQVCQSHRKYAPVQLAGAEWTQVDTGFESTNVDLAPTKVIRGNAWCSNNGQFIARRRRKSADHPNPEVRLWEVADGPEQVVVSSLDNLIDGAWDVAFSSDSRYLACLFGDGSLKIVDLVNKRRVGQAVYKSNQRKPFDSIRGVGVSERQNRVVVFGTTKSGSNTGCLWDLHQGERPIQDLTPLFLDNQVVRKLSPRDVLLSDASSTFSVLLENNTDPTRVNKPLVIRTLLLESGSSIGSEITGSTPYLLAANGEVQWIEFLERLAVIRTWNFLTPYSGPASKPLSTEVTEKFRVVGISNSGALLLSEKDQQLQLAFVSLSEGARPQAKGLVPRNTTILLSHDGTRFLYSDKVQITTRDITPPAPKSLNAEALLTAARSALGQAERPNRHPNQIDQEVDGSSVEDATGGAESRKG